MKIHETAIISKDAELASDVEVGPYTIIEPGVVIESGCKIMSRVSIKMGVHLGQNNVVCEGTVLGGMPQHIHCGNEVGGIRIGSGNMIRENSTIHRAMYPDSYTLVGNDNLLMVNSHVAHDCVVGNNVILTNNVMLAGHVTVEDRANVSGGVAVHQHCRVGMFAMVGGQAHVVQDVPPFVTVDGRSSLVVGLNNIGLRRAQINESEIRAIRAAYDIIYSSSRTWKDLLAELRIRFTSGLAAHFAEFLEVTKRGIIQERRNKTLRLVRRQEEERKTQQEEIVREITRRVAGSE